MRPHGEVVIIEKPQSKRRVEPADRLVDSSFHEQAKARELWDRRPPPPVLVAPPPSKDVHLAKVAVRHFLNQLRRRRIIRHRPNEPNPPALTILVRLRDQ